MVRTWPLLKTAFSGFALLIGVYSGAVTIVGSVIGQLPTWQHHALCALGTLAAAILIVCLFAIVAKVSRWFGVAAPQVPAAELKQMREFVATAADFSAASGSPANVAIAATSIEANNAERFRTTFSDLGERLKRCAENAEEGDFNLDSFEPIDRELERIVEDIVYELGSESRLSLLTQDTPNAKRWEDIKLSLESIRTSVRETVLTDLRPHLSKLRNGSFPKNSSQKAKKSLRALADSVRKIRNENVTMRLGSVDELVAEVQGRLHRWLN